MITELSGVAVGTSSIAATLPRQLPATTRRSFCWFRLCSYKAASERWKSPSDSTFPWPHIENAKFGQLNVFAVGERTQHGLEYRLDGNLGLGLVMPVRLTTSLMTSSLFKEPSSTVYRPPNTGMDWEFR